MARLEVQSTILALPPISNFEGLKGSAMADRGERVCRAVELLAGVTLDALVDVALSWSPAADTGEALLDELSAYVCALNRREPDQIRRKVMQEAFWTSALMPYVETWAAGHLSLADLLTQAATLIFDAPQSFRRSSAAIIPDTLGRQVVFPSPKQSADMICEADLYARDLLRTSPSLIAILVMVTVLHAHPFGDGNGRVSRTLFAAILRWGTASDVNIPVLAFECTSYRSYLVRVRRAQCFGDWMPLTSHILITLNEAVSQISLKRAGFSKHHLLEHRRHSKSGQSGIAVRSTRAARRCADFDRPSHQGDFAAPITGNE